MQLQPIRMSENISSSTNGSLGGPSASAAFTAGASQPLNVSQMLFVFYMCLVMMAAILLNGVSLRLICARKKKLSIDKIKVLIFLINLFFIGICALCFCLKELRVLRSQLACKLFYLLIDSFIFFYHNAFVLMTVDRYLLICTQLRIRIVILMRVFYAVTFFTASTTLVHLFQSTCFSLGHYSRFENIFNFRSSSSSDSTTTMVSNTTVLSLSLSPSSEFNASSRVDVVFGAVNMTWLDDAFYDRFKHLQTTHNANSSLSVQEAFVARLLDRLWSSLVSRAVVDNYVRFLMFYIWFNWLVIILLYVLIIKYVYLKAIKASAARVFYIKRTSRGASLAVSTGVGAEHKRPNGRASASRNERAETSAMLSETDADPVSNLVSAAQFKRKYIKFYDTKHWKIAKKFILIISLFIGLRIPWCLTSLSIISFNRYLYYSFMLEPVFSPLINYDYSYSYTSHASRRTY